MPVTSVCVGNHMGLEIKGAQMRMVLSPPVRVIPPFWHSIYRSDFWRHFCGQERAAFVPILYEGYEPKSLLVTFWWFAMERAQSVPTRGSTTTAECNPFYSEKVRSEMHLEAARPLDLPKGSTDRFNMEPVQSSPGVESQPQRVVGPTGKGRGGHSAGLLDALQPTESGLGSLRTEGELPVEDGLRTMGPVGPVEPPKKSTGKTDDGDLQRALEGELVNFLRCQNSKLLAEVASLRDKLEKNIRDGFFTMVCCRWGWVNGGFSTTWTSW